METRTKFLMLICICGMLMTQSCVRYSYVSSNTYKTPDVMAREFVENNVDHKSNARLELVSSRPDTTVANCSDCRIYVFNYFTGETPTAGVVATVRTDGKRASFVKPAEPLILPSPH